MRTVAVYFALLSLCPPAAAEKPRVFVTDAHSIRIAAEPAGDQGQALVEATEGISARNLVILDRFVELCPEVTVTGNADKADYIVRVSRAEPSPFTPFVKGVRIAIFNLDDDLIHTASAHYVKQAVRDVCDKVAALPAR